MLEAFQSYVMNFSLFTIKLTMVIVSQIYFGALFARRVLTRP